MSGAVADIEAVMRDYLDGLYRCDTALLARVFHPQALYATAAGDVTRRSTQIWHAACD